MLSRHAFSSILKISALWNIHLFHGLIMSRSFLSPTTFPGPRLFPSTSDHCRPSGKGDFTLSRNMSSQEGKTVEGRGIQYCWHVTAGTCVCAQLLLHPVSAMTGNNARCMWNIHLYLKQEVNILYWKWLLSSMRWKEEEAHLGLEHAPFSGYSVCACEMSCFSMCWRQHSPST